MVEICYDSVGFSERKKYSLKHSVCETMLRQTTESARERTLSLRNGKKDMDASLSKTDAPRFHPGNGRSAPGTSLSIAERCQTGHTVV